MENLMKASNTKTKTAEIALARASRRKASTKKTTATSLEVQPTWRNRVAFCECSFAQASGMVDASLRYFEPGSVTQHLGTTKALLRRAWIDSVLIEGVGPARKISYRLTPAGTAALHVALEHEHVQNVMSLRRGSRRSRRKA